MRQYLLLILALRTSEVASFAAGSGFGAPRKESKKKGKRKPSSRVQELPKEESKPPPVLDKWGLPPPTHEDLFPSPDPSTLQPCQQDEYTTEQVQALLEEYLPVTAQNVQVLHESPPVVSIPNFLTPHECQEILALQDDAYQVPSATFAHSLATRTSTSWFLHYKSVPTLVQRICKTLSCRRQQLEEPQLVRYAESQEFSWHLDEIPVSNLPNGGQRVATILVYLNSLDEGGSTTFRDLQTPTGERLAVQPQQGTALLFFPANRQGIPDDRTLHAGSPAIANKWIAQVWIHQDDYTASLPPGNVH